MIEELNSAAIDDTALQYNNFARDGFVFTFGRNPAVFDTLVIRYPSDASGPIYGLGYSERSLEDHIELINKYQLKKASIICKDLSFILRCPSLNDISVYPDHESGNGFDFSPLYKMPNLRVLNCITTYGFYDQYRSTIDYSRIDGLCDVAVYGPDHLGYERVSTLERLWCSRNKKHKDLRDISCSPSLKNITFLQCSIQSLDGIEQYEEMDSVTLYNNRSLKDISALAHVGSTLRSLTIDGCSKVTDFSVLKDLHNLEYLQLYGSNQLPSLDFLQGMKKMKVFTFTMNVENGDLRLCMGIPYVSCKNRKHYNLRDSQLPKPQVLSDSHKGAPVTVEFFT